MTEWDLYTFWLGLMKFVWLYRFDADLNAAKDESSSEVQAKAKLAREKEQLQVDFAELKEKIKVRGRETAVIM